MIDKEPVLNPIDVRFKTITKYHYFFFSLYFFGTRFPSVWHLLNFLFLAPPMSYTCEGTNETNYCPCTKPDWDTSVFTKTIQMKYGILCDTKWLISLSETLCVSGLLIGSLVFGSMSDRFGRLKMLCISSFILATAGCLVTVMPNVASFIVMRMVEGMGMAGVIVSGYVLCIEYCGIKYRETISAILHIPINMGHMAIAGISYSLRNCDHFQLAVSAPMFLTTLYWWILLESPKWLLDKNRREKALFTMEKFCVFNKGPNCETITAEIESYQIGPRGQSLKLHQIFKQRAMIKNFLCMAYLSFNCGLGYFGVTQFIDNSQAGSTPATPGKEELNKCPCKAPLWDTTTFPENMQSRFGLICDKNYLVGLSATFGYFGMLVGSFLFGFLSDRFGRVLMFSVTCVISGAAGVALSQSNSVVFFFVFKFLQGVGNGGLIVTGFVTLIEYTGAKYRETMTALYHLPVNFGHFLIAPISYGIRNPFTWQLVTSIPMFIFAFTFLLVRESPLWLMDKRKIDKAVKAMEKIAKFNGKQDTTIRADIQAYYKSRTTEQNKSINICHIFKFKKTTINLLCMTYLYLVCGMGFYGVSQYITRMNADIHLNIGISALLTVPGTVSCVFLLKKIGRKPLLMGTLLAAGVFMLITVVIPGTVKPEWVRVIFACFANCFFFMAFIVVFLYGVELFPTQVRNSALGFCALMARAGMMIAPQINSLSTTVAGYVFAALALAGGVLTLCLPETKNRDLPSTLQEAEEIGTKSKAKTHSLSDSLTLSLTRS